MNGEGIKTIRNRIGVSQKRLAEMLQVHWRTVQNWEKGCDISHEDYTRLCALLPSAPVTSLNTGVPYYDVDFECGFDEMINDQTTNPDFFIDFTPYNKADCWCRGHGDSMYPEIKSGDIIALKELHDWQTFILYGEIYGIITDEYRTVKRVCASDKPGHIRLVPTNVSGGYSPQDLPLSSVRKVYRVLGSMSRF